jgi:uncharacterized membrane protein
VLALGLCANNVAAAEKADAAKGEKCYGVVKAGKNDCQTATSACAGQSKTDNQADAYIYVPKGTCDRIVGGSTGAPKS